MSDSESVVTVDYNIEKEIEYGRKLIKDDIKNCKNCKLIYYQLKNNFNVFTDGVNENFFSYIGCSDCVSRNCYLDYDVSTLIYSLVRNNEYPEHEDIILQVLSGFNPNFCCASIYANIYVDNVYIYETDFCEKYSELYNKQIHDKFEDAYNHYFNEKKVKELKELLVTKYNECEYYSNIVDLKQYLYHYLRIFSMIITYLNKRQVFYDLIQWLKFIVIDQP